MDFEAILPFQFFALVLGFVGLPRVGALNALYGALGILLLAQFMIVTRASDRGRGLRYWITNELYAAITVVGPFAILAYMAD
jgi:hypothetical protein